jgi:hypothetical protein
LECEFQIMECIDFQAFMKSTHSAIRNLQSEIERFTDY